MLKSTIQRVAIPKTVRFATIAFSSVAAVLAACQSASAQLDVGRYGIQPGLESEYLQYQIKNPNLNQMRVIPGCNVGFGLSCNKTGSVLQKLVELNGGPSYEQLLIRAAGGQQNFQNFAGFYSNNPNLSKVPFASFWKNDSTTIMDGYQYVLGQDVSRTPVQGLGLVTKNFYWSPYSGSNNSPSLRDALVDVKLSYGRSLYEEAAKVPNIGQQIQRLDLPSDMTKFYLNNLSRGLDALNSGDKNRLQNSIFQLLSYPYPEYGGQMGRPINAIPQQLSQLAGEGIPGNVLITENPMLLEGEAIGLEIPSAPIGDVVVPGSSAAFPWGPVIGAGGLALLLLLLLSGGDSSSGENSAVATVPDLPPIQPSPPVQPTPPIQPSPPVQPTPNQCIPSPNGNGSPGSPVVEVPCKPNTPPPDVKKVVEPSTSKALVLLIVVLFVLRYKQQCMKIIKKQIV